jgi:alpha-mannosidase
VLALHQTGGYWNAGNLGHPCFWGDTAGEAPNFERARQTILDLLPSLDPKGVLPALVVWNGADHTPPQSDLPPVIDYLDQNLGSYRVRHGSVHDYISALSADSLDLSTVRGELRESRYQSLLTSTLSARVYLKQANHSAQRLLQSYTEPLSALGWALGEHYPAAEIREAWRLLLLNHAHDSICGCSIDQVHREMAARFEQVEQIGQGLVDRSVGAWIDRVDTTWCTPGQAPVLAFNPLSRPRREVAPVTLHMSECPQAFRVTDFQGKTNMAQVLACECEQYDWIPRQASAKEITEGLALWRAVLRDLHGVDLAGYRWPPAGEPPALHLLFGDRYGPADKMAQQLVAEVARLPGDTQFRLEAFGYAIQLVFRADVPALGYGTFAFEACDSPSNTTFPFTAGQRAIENEHVRVEVEQDGSLTMLHKATGWEYRGLHRFEDGGDAGDTYDFCPVPGPDEQAMLRGTPEVTLIEAGPLQAALRLSWEFEIAEALAADRQTRSARRVALPIASIIRLRAGSPYVEITTTLENHARDHRLRVHFPTGISSALVHADGHMAIASRSVHAPVGRDWVQAPSGLQPHQTWFAIDDDTHGLAILSQGLPEHEGLETEAGVTLALTLLRGVGWLSRGDLVTRRGHAGPAIATPEAQCLGTHSFRYGVLPYQGVPARTSLPQLAAAFDVPLLSSSMPVRPGKLPPRQGFISLEPDELVLSAVKRSESGDRLVVRCYNASESRVSGQIRLGFSLEQAWQATAAEQATRQIVLEADGTRLDIEAEGHEIVTLLLCPVGPQGTAKP